MHSIDGLDPQPSDGGAGMELSIQAALVSVSDLERSIKFYREVFDLRLASEGDRVAARLINEMARSQVLALREVGPKALRPGRGNVGLRLLAFEAVWLDQLDVIQARLAQLGVLVGQLQTENHRSVHGLNPDRIDLPVASSLTAGPIRSEDWHDLNEGIYGFGE
jgi:catechol 2,3-dioxygenase-like lactoylglutathione lyase family enzyme